MSKFHRLSFEVNFIIIIRDISTNYYLTDLHFEAHEIAWIWWDWWWCEFFWPLSSKSCFTLDICFRKKTITSYSAWRIKVVFQKIMKSSLLHVESSTIKNWLFAKISKATEWCTVCVYNSCTMSGSNTPKRWWFFEIHQINVNKTSRIKWTHAGPPK